MNMSYCQFENTLRALRECQENFTSSRLSESEREARASMLELFVEILQDCTTNVDVEIEGGDIICTEYDDEESE